MLFAFYSTFLTIQTFCPLQALFRKTDSKPEDNGELYQCSQCPYKTTVLAQIYSHEAHKHNADINACKACGLTFSNLHLLVKHTRQVHGKHLPAKSLKVNDMYLPLRD